MSVNDFGCLTRVTECHSRLIKSLLRRSFYQTKGKHREETDMLSTSHHPHQVRMVDYSTIPLMKRKPVSQQ